VERKTGGSQEVVEIAGTVDDTMYLNGLSTDGIEGEIRFDHQDAIAACTEPGMSRYSSEERIERKSPHTFIKSVDKRHGSSRTVYGDEFEDGKEILLSSRKITQCGLSGHSVVCGVLPSSADG
jgi:hypothetical protein